MREKKMKSRNQLGVNMIGLITWMILAVVIMGGVVVLFTETSKQTAIGAEQNQQQQSILNALNRVSRDVSISNPIVYASPTEIVMDVNKDDGTSVERRRYLLNLGNKEVWEYSKPIQRGAPYDNASANSYWNSADVDRKSKTVYNVDTDVAEDTTPFLEYFDSAGSEIVGIVSTSKDAEAIARVDIALTADVANKGKVSLSTSAVPRATSNLGATAQPILAPCPAFTATRTGDTVVLRWDKASDEVTSYEITRNGVTIQPTTIVSDSTKLKYSYTDTPGNSSTVMNYMLKVVSAAGISNCIDSVRPIVITAGSTQLDSDLVPVTTLDGSSNPISTAWTNSTETTKVSLKWQKVDIASGYVVYRQRLNADGSYNGDRQTVATLENYPYVDLNSSTLAPAELSYVADAGWDEYWEWSIKVMSRTGDNEDTPETRTLSYPKPVSSAAISALPVKKGTVGKVSDSDLAAGYGNTRVTWTYTAGMEARGFDIYRSAMDTPASNFPAGFTKIGSSDAGTSEYFDRRAELGSTYGYYVVAKNKSGFSNSYASQRVQQLQFPPDPVLAAVGVTGSRDLTDGTNRVRWAAAKSATGYHVERANINASSIICASGANCAVNSGGIASSQTQYDDTRSDVDPATRFTYAAFSYNATGLSPQLGAKATLTQRPSAPAMSKTADPTLNSTVTSITYNATAGSWCVSGTYTGTGNNCAYEQRQYHVNGTLRHAASDYVTSFNWGNQDWGRHYTYNVRAQNAAITNGGWSELSGTAAADTYPGNFGVGFGRGDAWGNQSQRFIYNSSFITTNTSETDHTRKFDGAAYTTIAWGTPAGSRTVLWERFSEGGGSTIASGDGSLYLPSSTYMSGWSDWGSSNRAEILAAPGGVYGAKVTAWGIENNLTRSINGPSVTTPADMPQSGYMQMVCSGPWDNTPAGYGQAAAIEYAKRSFGSQSYGSRLQSLNKSPRYGWYSDTVIQGKFQDHTGIGSNYWYQGPDGRYWYVERLAKGSVGYYQNGNGGVWGWGQANPNGYDGNGIGQATHRYNVGHGFTLYNRLNAEPGLSSYWMFILMDEAATRGGCGDGWFQEPYDACYEWTGTSGCFSLNQNGYDGRPRWTTK
jgi:hypothetical protein